VEVFINGESVKIDREVIKISDLLGLKHIRRIPGMKISLNGKPIRQTLWIKYPLLDGDRLVYEKPVVSEHITEVE
jgi:sulfur carrier protein ThiS